MCATVYACACMYVHACVYMRVPTRASMEAHTWELNPYPQHLQTAFHFPYITKSISLIAIVTKVLNTRLSNMTEICYIRCSFIANGVF